jgi:hypothetical protein
MAWFALSGPPGGALVDPDLFLEVFQRSPWRTLNNVEFHYSSHSFEHAVAIKQRWTDTVHIVLAPEFTSGEERLAFMESVRGCDHIILAHEGAVEEIVQIINTQLQLIGS